MSKEQKKHRFKYFDGAVREAAIIDEEFPYPSGEMIISRTNKEGIITHANRAFVLISGYSKEELIGTPHYIIRHPDMPKAAFKDLWDTVQLGKKWHGYVKNLRKDGRYYWVYATVVANYDSNKQIKGYTSVRREASRQKINYCTKLYQELLEKEIQEAIEFKGETV